MNAPVRRVISETSAVDLALSATRVSRIDGPSSRESHAPTQIVSTNRERWRFVEELIMAKTLAPIERLVGVRLALFLNIQTGQLNPSFETIAASTGMGVRTAKRHVQALIHAGWIIKRSRRGRVSNEYELIIPTVPLVGTVR